MSLCLYARNTFQGLTEGRKVGKDGEGAGNFRAITKLMARKWHADYPQSGSDVAGGEWPRTLDIDRRDSYISQ